MTPQPSTSLLVRFAKAMGYKCEMVDQDHRWDGYVWNVTNPADLWLGQFNEVGLAEILPSPTDANTVREAMMGMTEVEWGKFSVILNIKLGGCNGEKDAIRKALKTPPTTLAELICEVRIE